MAHLLKLHFIYWVIPTLYALLVMALYFSGSHELVDWVTPRTMTHPWSEYGDRELGILENAQHLLLLASILVIARGLSTSTPGLHRSGMIGAMLVLTFMLLEEISYGTHYWDFLTGAPEFKGDFNLHNTDRYTTHRMKQAADIIMVVWFVILPLVAHYRRSVWLKYFAPTRMFIFTLIAAVCISKFAHFLDDNGYDIRPSLSSNISEFRELFTYYVWFVYSLLMARRPWPGRQSA